MAKARDATIVDDVAVAESGHRFSSSPNMLARLRDIGRELSPSDKKLAALVLAEASRVTRMNLATFASEARVSQPTAIRFCRALGCDGFPDFKIRVAQALMVGAPFVHGEITADDGLAAVADKIFASSIDALQLIRAQLDLHAIERAVSAIARAPRIELFGGGLSSVAAIDAHQKFMRLGVPTIHHIDNQLQRMSAATLRPGDVAIAFAYTGRVRDVVITGQMAVKQGATLIGVTRSDSPLARISAITIGIDTLENTFVYAPMTTRMAHLAVVDVLSTAVALRSGPSGVDQIQKVKTAMSDQWMIGYNVGAPAAADDED